MIKAILFDISGVLYIDEQALPKAVETIQRLREDSVPMRFVTNTSRSTHTDILIKLQALGFSVHDEEVFTAPVAIKQVCLQRGLRPFCLIHPDLKPEFAELEQDNPNAVVVADAAEYFYYQRLNKAFALLINGVPLLGIGMNRYFKTGDRLQLDAGPFIKALEFAAGVSAEILGKPALGFFQTAVSSLACEPEEVLMIGDDVEADVLGAIHAGLHGCLVKTGKYLAGDEHKLTERAGCAASVSEAVERYFYGVR